MYYSTRLLVLLALQTGLVYSFSWDIVEGGTNQLEFFYNGTLTHTEHFLSTYDIKAVTYDPVHYRVLFAYDNNGDNSISSFDLSTRTIEPLVTSRTQVINCLNYDPVTQLLFWQERWANIYSFSLDPSSSNKVVNEDAIVTLINFQYGITVDSCEGYIYWSTANKIERVRFDGSEREVLIERSVSYRISLAIDQNTQKIYWIDSNDNRLSIKSADLKGKNETTLYIVENEIRASSLTVSKDFIYWTGEDKRGIWQLPKEPRQRVEAKLFSISNSASCWYCQRVAANYSIEEQTQGIKSCEALKSMISNPSPVPNSRDETIVCVYGTKVSGQSRCECTQGYTGERCEVYSCQNYCIQGNCSVSTEGQPKCSCKAGYSGERCEVNTCHRYCLNGGVCSLNEDDQPVCKCTADYDGERCDISICKDYCLQGNCSVSAEGQPICSCKAGYSGTRCEVNACHDYCSNNGVCSLKEEDEPICECTPDFEGERCDVSICKDYCLQGNCSVSAEGQPKCSCTAGYSGERCEVNACHDYCSNNGVCYLNEEDEPVCECTAEYEGERCGVPTSKDNICVSDEGQTKYRYIAGNSGEGKVNACHQYCLNNGTCFLNEENEPICQCTTDYEGERCDVPAFLIKCFIYAYKNKPQVTMSKGVKSTCDSIDV